MEYSDIKYDSLFMKYAKFNHLPWRLIKSQAWQESRFKSNAVSPVGARGLMQLMPETAFELGGEVDLFDPEINISLGCKYDKIQFDKFPEIFKVDERLKFMLGAYNGGRGYINKALAIARYEELGKEDLKGSPPGMWQTWLFASKFLSDERCTVGGRRPDSYQIVEYVDKIWSKFISDLF